MNRLRLLSTQGDKRRYPCTLRILLSSLFCLVLFRAAVAEISEVRYTLSLARASEHFVQVQIDLPPGVAQRELQLPTWNALYQIRDFAQFVYWVKAKDTLGNSLPVRKLNKSLWRVDGTAQGASIEYEILADDPPPFGAQLNSHHGFFNLAQILMYPVDGPSAPIRIGFTNLPEGWKIATPLASSASAYTAENYDRLVDSPFEIGDFQETSFEEDDGHYRVVVDADSNDFDMQTLVSMLRPIVAAATGWMNDRPYETYTFFYHFPHTPTGGGMEHAYSTAINFSASRLGEGPQALAGLTAHEFFHLWNVKRIRPQALEPVDYTKENYTRALWFSEGGTSTVSNIILLRAGIMNEAGFLKELAGQIAALEQSPARLTQSAEESSLDAWLEKYDSYRSPLRSISYYNKGYLDGILLDLQMREVSQGRICLRDLFQWMNHDAKQGRFFTESDGIEQAAETLTHTSFADFFQKYVAGTQEIPWDDFFRAVGLHLVREPKTEADLGFWAPRNFDKALTVAGVTPNSDAERAGLRRNDAILKFGGHAVTADFQQRIAALQPGDTIRLRVKNASGDHNVEWKLQGRQTIEFLLRDVENMTAQQKARRVAWLKGESQAAEVQP